MPAPKKSSAKNAQTNNPSNNLKAASTNTNSSTAVAELPQKPQAQQAKAQQNNTVTQAKAGTTQVVAQIDVGYGNKLTIRGQGAGLSWDKGQLMIFQNNAWNWSTTNNQSFEFKVLLNDQQWQQGNNIQAKAGSKIVFKPQF